MKPSDQQGPSSMFDFASEAGFMLGFLLGFLALPAGLFFLCFAVLVYDLTRDYLRGDFKWPRATRSSSNSRTF